MHVVVATHGNCFDGLASAVLFTKLWENLNGSGASFTYRGCGYGLGHQRPESVLSGDDNALLDYRFSRHPRLGWYFDHHRTAFPVPGDRAVFAERAPQGQYFFDESSPSCAQLIARVARERFACDEPRFESLVAWANRVDAAQFDSAEQALRTDDPVLQLVSVIEHFGCDSLLAQLVPRLLERPVQEVAADRDIENRYVPLRSRRDQFTERVRSCAVRLGRVVLVDLSAAVVESIEKFVTYALYPDAVYSVVVGLRRHDVNISVGYNPWSGAPRDADISAICARHGGGGHPVVGAISLERARLDQARGLARQIAAELA